MDQLLVESLDSARDQLLGLLAKCNFASGPLNDCQLRDLRNSLTTEQKHEYVMSLSDKDVKSSLLQHEECFKKRLSELKVW